MITMKYILQSITTDLSYAAKTHEVQQLPARSNDVHSWHSVESVRESDDIEVDTNMRIHSLVTNLQILI